MIKKTRYHQSKIALRTNARGMNMDKDDDQTLLSFVYLCDRRPINLWTDQSINLLCPLFAATLWFSCGPGCPHLPTTPMTRPPPQHRSHRIVAFNGRSFNKSAVSPVVRPDQEVRPCSIKEPRVSRMRTLYQRSGCPFNLGLCSIYSGVPIIAIIVSVFSNSGRSSKPLLVTETEVESINNPSPDRLVITCLNDGSFGCKDWSVSNTQEALRSIQWRVMTFRSIQCVATPLTATGGDLRPRDNIVVKFDHNGSHKPCLPTADYLNREWLGGDIKVTSLEDKLMVVWVTFPPGRELVSRPKRVSSLLPGLRGSDCTRKTSWSWAIDASLAPSPGRHGEIIQSK
ncbi:hypothetical protein J6590_079263 [Homalodisca vitripennis]|nr:hypothetical protein J6590_079263 [Homalodisca vitripennis]